MIYAYRENGKWVQGSLRSTFRGVNGFHRLTDEQRAKLGWYPLVISPYTYNPATQVLGPLTNWRLKNNIVYAEYRVWNKPLTQIKQEKQQSLAARRYKAETAGITFNGMHISTERTDQAMLTGAYNATQQNPTRIINWKTKDGFIPLNKDAIDALSNAVSNHIQACFDNEMAISKQITDDSIITAEQVDNIDIEQGWPE